MEVWKQLMIAEFAVKYRSQNQAWDEAKAKELFAALAAEDEKLEVKNRAGYFWCHTNLKTRGVNSLYAELKTAVEQGPVASETTSSGHGANTPPPAPPPPPPSPADSINETDIAPAPPTSKHEKQVVIEVRTREWRPAPLLQTEAHSFLFGESGFKASVVSAATQTPEVADLLIEYTGDLAFVYDCLLKWPLISGAKTKRLDLFGKAA